MSGARQIGDIDRLWTEFWTGGITNPMTFVEQVSFLMFIRMLDETEARDGFPTETALKPRFNGKGDARRWSNFKGMKAESMLPFVRDEVFAHLRQLDGGSSFAQFLKDAQLSILSPRLLESAVKRIDAFPLEGDAMGDVYEHLLAKLSTAGALGQFRTPRHIVRFMVDLLAPAPGERIADPACGTAGFLVGALEYLREKRPGTEPPKGEGAGARSLLCGFEIDPAMLRIATMNLMVRGATLSEVHYHDTLASSFMTTFPTMAIGGFDVVLANPPFSNRADMSEVDPSLMEKGAATKRTELLFMTRILQMLRSGGRSAAMMPLGVLSNGTKAHLALRKTLITENRLEAVISLPAGVFLPYAGVATAILVLRKGGKTDHVFFARVEADGFSLNTKRVPLDVSDLPMTLARWKNRAPSREKDRTAKHFMVPVAELEARGFDLAMGRYAGRAA